MKMEIKNLKKAANRILKAVANKEKLILYGDADLDGVTSVIILKETLKSLGAKIEAIYFPDREKEGYGINISALQFLKDKAPALFLVVDCGIGNFAEVKIAKKLGFEVIIIDHHEILDGLPAALIIVDPKQKGDKYQFKGLATAGIVFKLSELLFKGNMVEALRKNFLELVVLATIADMMPQEQENRIFLEEGLKSLKNSWRPGLKVFWQIEAIRNYGTTEEAVQKIISALNTSEVKDHLNETYLLLTSNSLEESEKLAKDLLEKSYQKQMRIREITEEIERRVSEKPSEIIIFEGSPGWLLTLIGSAASRVCQKFKKPAFLFKLQETESIGAVRTPSALNGVEAMKNCSQWLETYGGHPRAAGFRIKNENLEKFRECLVKYFSEHVN